mmetsp:Transcript_28077/g.71565  ORF Transcript_28077/g.71565 Transcript_28077/m.71565 type:complete len:214 (+) Transcript_28077:296-937(+)
MRRHPPRAGRARVQGAQRGAGHVDRAPGGADGGGGQQHGCQRVLLGGAPRPSHHRAPQGGGRRPGAIHRAQVHAARLGAARRALAACAPCRGRLCRCIPVRPTSHAHNLSYSGGSSQGGHNAYISQPWTLARSLSGCSSSQRRGCGRRHQLRGVHGSQGHGCDDGGACGSVAVPRTRRHVHTAPGGQVRRAGGSAASTLGPRSGRPAVPGQRR